MNQSEDHFARLRFISRCYMKLKWMSTNLNALRGKVLLVKFSYHSSSLSPVGGDPVQEKRNLSVDTQVEVKAND